MSFNIARFEHVNEMRRKALKQKKKMESSPFWNPESTELESGIQYSESGIHRVGSRIQDCHGFPYMGRNWAIKTHTLGAGKFVEFILTRERNET